MASVSMRLDARVESRAFERQVAGVDPPLASIADEVACEVGAHCGVGMLELGLESETMEYVVCGWLGSGSLVGGLVVEMIKQEEEHVRFEII